MDGVSLRRIGERLGRSEDAVDERRRCLNVTPRRHTPGWTAAEDALVRAAASAGLADGPVARRLGRTVEQVRYRRHLLVGPKWSPRPYTAVDDEVLRARWRPGEEIGELARELGRSVGSVRLRAQKIGLHRPACRRRWLPDEDMRLRDGYEHALSCEQIANRLPGRTSGAVAARAAKLGVATHARAWSARDDHRLRALCGEGLTVDAMALILGRTPQALVMRLRRLDISHSVSSGAVRSGRRWTAAEDEVLRVNGALNPAALAGVLGRSSGAVTQRMLRLGVRQGRSPHHPVPRRRALTPGEEVTAARELRAGGPGRVFSVARRLDIPVEVIRTAAAEAASSSARPDAGRARANSVTAAD